MVAAPTIQPPSTETKVCVNYSFLSPLFNTLAQLPSYYNDMDPKWLSFRHGNRSDVTALFMGLSEARTRSVRVAEKLSVVTLKCPL